MEQQWNIAESTQGISQAACAEPRGTLAGTVLAITALLLSYVGVGFVRLLF